MQEQNRMMGNGNKGDEDNNSGTPIGRGFNRLMSARPICWIVRFLRYGKRLFELPDRPYSRAARLVVTKDMSEAWWQCPLCEGFFHQHFKPSARLGRVDIGPPRGWTCESCKAKRLINDELADYRDGASKLCEWLGVPYSEDWAADVLRKVADDRQALTVAQRRDLLSEIGRLAGIYETIGERAAKDSEKEKAAIARSNPTSIKELYLAAKRTLDNIESIGSGDVLELCQIGKRVLSEAISRGGGVSIGELCRLQGRAELAQGVQRRLNELAQPIMGPLPPADHFGELLEGVLGMYRAKAYSAGMEEDNGRATVAHHAQGGGGDRDCVVAVDGY